MTHLRKIRTSPVRLASLVFIGAVLISACSPAGSKTDLAMAPMADMPQDVQSAPVSVSDAYRFAVANPDLLEGIPCYCGCGSIGHTSNYDCYIQSDGGAPLAFDTHALGCGICVDITRDVMQMTRDGKSPADIRAAIDGNYAQFGPSNQPRRHLLDYP